MTEPYTYSPYGDFPWEPVDWLPVKQPYSRLNYAVDLRTLSPNPYLSNSDPILSLSLNAKPSGTLELALSNLSLDQTGYIVSFTLSEGVPGRIYILNLLATTTAGLVYQYPIGIVCNPLLGFYPFPPEDPWFGPPITWGGGTAPVGIYNQTLWNQCVYGGEPAVIGIYDETTYGGSVYA